MADEEEQISSDDQNTDLTDYQTNLPRRSYKSIPDSYSYRLTHDISLDNFQSADLFDPENDLNLPIHNDCSFLIQNNTPITDLKNIRERHHSNSSSDILLKEDMIELDLSNTNVLSEHLTNEQVDNEGDTAATTLLNIMQSEGSRRNSQVVVKTDDSDNSCRNQRQKRKTKRKGRKLPQMPPSKPEPYALQRPTRLEFNTTSTHYTPFLTNTNMLLQEDSSPEERQMRRLRQKAESKTREEEEKTEGKKEEERPCFQPATLVINGEIKQQSHVAVFRFLPRHEDELAFEVHDPVFVEYKCDDLWYEGINLKTGDEGCFPGQYVRDFTADTECIPGFRGRKVHVNRYMVKFLGSVEVAFHKGNDVLCRAMQKVVTARRLTIDIHPPTLCLLEISDIGVKMVDKTKPQKLKEKRDSVLKKVEKLLGSKQSKGHNYFFSLKNVSFCGYHPSSSRYFGFITKHPSEKRHACHVFIMEDGVSAKPVAEAMGAAFKRFYSEFLDFTDPTEDIYME
ncbi:C-Jun-amino-terminal kinase-interacting protein 1-like isoform X3 [Asterias rubens]|uniref:C-Jun-amino-terminal kinase-interacting protein 1-like isoform X3 n=1 Tax=Asterias rubens TaxID=7604 RepID=UPI0014553B40|nr:C-Jun-amino-terminal kinase-interacting protein 1-like isoform X3 [Asterias rubens]